MVVEEGELAMRNCVRRPAAIYLGSGIGRSGVAACCRISREQKSGREASGMDHRYGVSWKD